MKKSTFKFLAIAVLALLCTSVFAQTTYEITFQVDMTDANPFDPTTDDVYISGNFADWTKPGEDVAYKMEPLETGSMFYTLTVTIDSGEVEYKYYRVIDDTASWDNGEWDGDPNRLYYPTEDVTIENVWGDIDAGIFTQPNEFTYSMYPNPVVTVLNIDNTNDVTKVNVYDVNGRLVQTMDVFAQQNITINVAELQTGVYFVNVHNDKGVSTAKFVKN